MDSITLDRLLESAPDLDQSRFAILRHALYFNFVAANCPIPEEKFTIDDLLLIIQDVGKDYADRNKRGLCPDKAMARVEVESPIDIGTTDIKVTKDRETMVEGAIGG